MGGDNLTPMAEEKERSTERLTSDLLKRLLERNNLDEYLKEDNVIERDLPEYLHELRAKRGLNRNAVARSAGMNATYVYDIFSGKSKPGRDHAIALSLGLNCDLIETQRLLRLAGVAELWSKQRRDVIIIWCVNNGYDRVAVDNELIRFGERPLLDEA